MNYISFLLLALSVCRNMVTLFLSKYCIVFVFKCFFKNYFCGKQLIIEVGLNLYIVYEFWWVVKQSVSQSVSPSVSQSVSQSLGCWVLLCTNHALAFAIKLHVNCTISRSLSLSPSYYSLVFYSFVFL